MKVAAITGTKYRPGLGILGIWRRNRGILSPMSGPGGRFLCLWEPRGGILGLGGVSGHGYGRIYSPGGEHRA